MSRPMPPAGEGSTRGCLFSPEGQVGDGFGFSISASESSPGVLAVGAPTSGTAVDGGDAMIGDALPPHLQSALAIPGPGAGGPGSVTIFTVVRAAEEATGNSPSGVNEGRHEIGSARPTMTCHLKPPDAEGIAMRFGHCVSVSSRGCWLAVGAPHATRNDLSRSGVVFVYRHHSDGQFVLDQAISDDYGLENDRFGWSCSIDELGEGGAESYSAVLVCGCFASSQRDAGRGGGFIQIYQRHDATAAWHLIKTYDPEGNGKFFGYSVGVSGDFVAVGDPADNYEFKKAQGTVWGWERDSKAAVALPGDGNKSLSGDNWVRMLPREKLTCSACGMNPLTGDRYKCSGCPNYRMGGEGIFMCSGCIDPETKKQRDPDLKIQSHTHDPNHTFWNLEEEPIANDPKYRKQDLTWVNTHGKWGGGAWNRSEPLQMIGSNVAASDRYQAAGAPGWNDGVGLVFVREHTSVKCKERGVVQAPDTVAATTTGYKFGSALDLKWPLLAVGAPGHSANAGAAYIFMYQAGAWVHIGERIHLQAERKREGSMFGSSVAFCASSLFVGATNYGSDSPGLVQFERVNHQGKVALSEEHQSMIEQCVKGRLGVSLPRSIFEHAVKSVARQKAAPWPLAKVMMVGEGRAGKTALRNALLGKVFAPFDSTIGIETLSVGRQAVTGTGHGIWQQSIEVDFEGSAETEMRERAVAKECTQELHKSSQVVVQMQRRSMEELIREKIAESFSVSSESTSTLSARAQPLPQDREAATLTTKLNGQGEEPIEDLETQLVLRRVEELMRTMDEGSEDAAMEIWDFGGQEIFYILYHLFLTDFGTYLLTFSMERLGPSATQGGRDECLAMIRYWLDNIALHTGTGREGRNASLVLVGTHKDMVSDPKEHEKISQLLWSTFGSHVQWPFVTPLKKGIVSTGRGLLWFFPVDNTRTNDQTEGGRDPVLNQLALCLEERIQSLDHLRRLVPFTWMKLYDKLQAKLRDGELVVGMQEVQDLAAGCSIPVNDLELALHYFDCMGLLLHCADNRMHKAAVVLDTVRFLVRAATLILCQHDIHHEENHHDAAQSHGAEWKDLVNNGILDTTLLQYIWKEFKLEDHATLLSLMHRFGLICSIARPHSTASTSLPSLYLVPSLLPHEDVVSELPTDAPKFFIAFSSGSISELSNNDTVTLGSLRTLFMPEGLFPRVVAKCVEWVQQTSRRQEKVPLGSMSLKRHGALLSFGPHRFVLQHLPDINSLRVCVLVQNTEVVIERLQTIIASVIADSYPKLCATILLPCSSVVESSVAELERATNGESGDASKLADSGRLLPLLSLRRAVEKKTGVWIGPSKTSTSQLSTRFATFLPPQGLLAAYDVFISYRWTPGYGAGCMDTELASKLFDVINGYAVGSKGRRPDVFLDRHRLEEGRRFDFDFMTAMTNSTVVVPLVSWDALQRMLKVQPNTPDRACDNVLLEWCLAMELLEQHKLKCVLPIMVGKIEGGVISNLFASGEKDRLPHIICDPEIKKVREYLEKMGWRESARLKTMTIKGVVDSICSCLGIMLWDLQASHGSPVDSDNTGQFGLFEAAAAKIMQNHELVAHREDAESALIPATQAVTGYSISDEADVTVPPHNLAKSTAVQKRRLPRWFRNPLRILPGDSGGQSQAESDGLPREDESRCVCVLS